MHLPLRNHSHLGFTRNERHPSAHGVYAGTHLCLVLCLLGLGRIATLVLLADLFIELGTKYSPRQIGTTGAIASINHVLLGHLHLAGIRLAASVSHLLHTEAK